MLSYNPLAGGWLSGRYRKDADNAGPTSAARPGVRFDMTTPGNQRKLDAADRLGALADESGISLIEMAIAFVLLGQPFPAGDRPSPLERRGDDNFRFRVVGEGRSGADDDVCPPPGLVVQQERHLLGLPFFPEAHGVVLAAA